MIPITSTAEPEIWDLGNGCQAISNLSNQAWKLASLYNQDQDEQKVPSWAALHAACGVSEAAVTVVGMMPIIHADEYNTEVTISNKFQEMMHHLGQKHVVIVGDLSIAKQNNYNGQSLINMIML